MTKTTIFCITGPESSGKSTLAAQLKAFPQVTLVNEYARIHLKTLSEPSIYDKKDLLIIAEQQFLNIEQAAKTGSRVIVDTGIEVVKIWYRERFKASHKRLEELLQKQNALISHYFICSPDMPWEQDPLRENPLDRDRLFEIYEELIKSFDVPYTVLSGSKEIRLSKAQNLIFNTTNS